MSMTPGFVPSLALIAALGAPAAARPQVERIDLSERGPSIGERVPDFNLNDQNGDRWTRDSILGANGAMLVFVRSADW